MSEEKILNLQGQKGRIDKLLSQLLPDYSRSKIQSMIEEGHIKVNGQSVKTNYKLKGQEMISLVEAEIEEIEIRGQAMDLDIMYEDESLLVINKERGQVVHPGVDHLEDTLVNGLIYYLGGQLSNLAGKYRPGIVHRIDKDTSGLLLVAKNNDIHQALKEALMAHKIERYYYALVYGQPASQAGRIEVPLKRDEANRLRYSAHPEGRLAITHFQVVESFNDYSLLKCQLETGRTHQIRVHMEYIGHPLFGDPVYQRGLVRQNYPLKDQRLGQYLHAKQLKFIHPLTGQVLTIDSPLPNYFKEIIDQIKEFNT